MLELHEVYIKADPNYTGRVTPTLWDRQKETIVNNEFRNHPHAQYRVRRVGGKRPAELVPKAHRTRIDELNNRIYETVNNGGSPLRFAKTQEAYEEYIGPMFETFDFLEGILSEQRYLVTDYPTEADWRLFVTLIRFDFVYFSHFKCNIRRIQDYPSLWHYTLDLYQTLRLTDVIDIPGIKRGITAGSRT